jgi:hypothetical protein
MNWAHWTYFILTGIGLLLVAHKHGQPRTEKHNVYVSLIVTAFVYLLLWQMGAFDAIGAA